MKFKKVLILGIIFAMILPLIMASSVNDNSIQKEIYKNNLKIKELYENDIELNKEIQNIEKEILNFSKQIGDKEKNLEEINLKIAEIESYIFTQNNEIEELNLKISDLEKNMSDNLKIIEQKKLNLIRYDEVINLRIKNLYKHVDNSNPIVSIFLTSTSILDLTDKFLSLGKFLESDKSILENLVKDIEDIHEKNKHIEMAKESINFNIKEVNDKIAINDSSKKEVEKIRNHRSKEIEDIVKLKNEYENRYKSLSTDKIMLQQEIIRVHQDNEKLQKEFNEYIKNLNENNKEHNSKVDYGSYKKPAVGKITSKYGKRVHPITSKESFHTGIDIAGKKNDSIFASLSGQVVRVGWYNNVYGNVIIINHGNNIQTFYAHLEKCLVNEGDEILRGEIIGKIGSTGLSTGPHLHFEIRVNGEHVDPMKRLFKT